MTSLGTENRSGLTGSDILRLRGRLLELRQQLLERLADDQSTMREAEPQTEPLDAAEQTREQDDSVAFAGRDQALLAEIERALAKIQTGSYGLSEASGEPIGLRRLLAVPWARYTIDEEEETGSYNDGDG
jgi:RNA polymerase-binding transcription factor